MRGMLSATPLDASFTPTINARLELSLKYVGLLNITLSCAKRNFISVRKLHQLVAIINQ